MGTDSPKRMDVRLAVECCAAIALQSYQSWLLFNGILPVTSSILSSGSEIQMAVGVVIEALILVCAMRSPRMLAPYPWLVVSLVCDAAGLGMLVWVSAGSGMIALGLAMRQAGSLLGFYLIGLALSRVQSARLIAVSASFAVLIATGLATFVPAPPYYFSVVLDAVLTLATLCLTWHAAAPLLGTIARGPAAEAQALLNPQSFLLPNHQVYVLIYIFSVAVGFGSSLRLSANTPLSSWLGIVLLAAVVAWFLLTPSKRERRREDVLFCASALLIVAGFLAVPLEGIGTGTANALLYAARFAFGILSWTALAVLCARNPAGSMFVLACGEFANGLGGFMGIELGYLCNALLLDRPQTVAIVTSVAVLLLFAYMFVGLKDFSFGETIRGVEPAQPLSALATSETAFDVSLEAACDAVAADYGLTGREREVLGILARGHNGYHVRDELSLSYNTVKTHVSRIYRKLDVHSQQELIDLVESTARQMRGFPQGDC